MKNIGQYILTALILTLLVVPPIVMLVRKASRVWLKEGIERGPGEDKAKLDLVEIWEMFYLFSAFICLAAFIYVIVNFTMFGTDYPWEIYGLSFTGSLGSQAAGVLLAYIKNMKKDAK